MFQVPQPTTLSTPCGKLTEQSRFEPKMKRPLPALDLDLRIEHRGRQASVQGSGKHFVAKCPTLLSLFHFLFALWPLRKQFPTEYNFQIEWRGFRFPRKNA